MLLRGNHGALRGCKVGNYCTTLRLLACTPDPGLMVRKTPGMTIMTSVALSQYNTVVLSLCAI